MSYTGAHRDISHADLCQTDALGCPNYFDSVRFAEALVYRMGARLRLSQDELLVNIRPHTAWLEPTARVEGKGTRIVERHVAVQLFQVQDLERVVGNQMRGRIADQWPALGLYHHYADLGRLVPEVSQQRNTHRLIATEGDEE